MKIYLIGSLRNPKIPEIANKLQAEGFSTFADWFAPGEEADSKWKAYETARGRSYSEALRGHAARHIFEFDKKHLDEADVVVMAMPAGKSGHLELGYTIGKGKPGYILFEEEPNPDRWDIMTLFATDVFFRFGDLVTELRRIQ